MSEKPGGSEDVRVQRTRRLIQHALFELTVEKGYAAVTVHDIAQRAMVNRSTFYRHYLDKYDLMRQYLDQLQAQSSEAALHAERTSRAAPERVPAGLLVLVQHVQEHAEFYRVMLGPHGDQEFTHRFRQLSERRYRYLFAQAGEGASSDGPPVEMRLSSISAAFVGAILWWLESERPATAEQLAIWLGQLSMTTAGLTSQPPRGAR